MRSGALAVPESFELRCPWCRLASLVDDRCPRCECELRCSGFGHVHTRLAHQLSCMEVACDLGYLSGQLDWQRVVDAYAARGESTDGNERATKKAGRQ